MLMILVMCGLVLMDLFKIDDMLFDAGSDLWIDFNSLLDSVCMVVTIFFIFWLIILSV